MAKATLSLAQMATLRSLRALDADTASTIRASMFTSIKDSFGIPAEHKVKVEIDDDSLPSYGVIIRKKTGEDYTLTSDGVWDEGIPEQDDDTPTAAQASGKTVVESRWFEVPRAAMSHGIISGGGKFTDGSLDAPAGALLPATGDNTKFPLVLTSDGTLHIKLDLVEDADDADDLGMKIIALLAKLAR